MTPLDRNVQNLVKGNKASQLHNMIVYVLLVLTHLSLLSKCLILTKMPIRPLEKILGMPRGAGASKCFLLRD